MHLLLLTTESYTSKSKFKQIPRMLTLAVSQHLNDSLSFAFFLLLKANMRTPISIHHGRLFLAEWYLSYLRCVFVIATMGLYLVPWLESGILFAMI